MKDKNRRKNQTDHQHIEKPQPRKENLETHKVKFGGIEYLIDYDKYSAEVRTAGNDFVIGLFRAATRTWKDYDLPMFVKNEVESLYL